MIEENIIKFITGHANEQESRDVLLWRCESDENLKEFNRLKNVWSLSSYSKVRTTEQQNRSYALVTKKLKLNKNRNLAFVIARYTAIIIFFFAAGVLIQNRFNLGARENITPFSNEVRVPFGQTASVVLCDGSVVWLNSGSKLLYSSSLVGDEQRVTLEGEAFFDIAKNSDRKFIVQTNVVDMHVYGTAFNVEAYAAEKIVRTTLIKGSLGVVTKSGVIKAKLTPGKRADFSRNDGHIVVRNVDTDIYTSWRNGLITFRNEPLSSIAKKLERWYNVKIEFRNSNLPNMLYSGTILKYKPIDQILEVLKLTANVNYKIEVKANKQSKISLY